MASERQTRDAIGWQATLLDIWQAEEELNGRLTPRQAAYIRDRVQEIRQAAQWAEELPRLSGKQLHKGTGDALKDLDYALRFVDGDGVVGALGKQLDFINRALRVARGEIVQLRSRLGRPLADPVDVVTHGE